MLRVIEFVYFGPKFAVYNTVTDSFISFTEENVWESFKEFKEVCDDERTRKRVAGQLDEHFHALEEPSTD